MKKFIFGVILIFLGFIFGFTCFNHTINNPCIVNGKEGLFISFVANNLLIPFIISLITCLCGIIICWYESFKR